ncbi:hypothetical protein G7Y89_g13868 [Cudoniella acicularis]|uniref:2EXR domain-containing protein n=1 Tax=Cudoniella acicularis TaxID=354080 RepID=A0A8H4R6F1_9HELO|nr:hypothetical protein G7Y89_g13868 [Cudoniella acicularis]
MEFSELKDIMNSPTAETPAMDYSDLEQTLLVPGCISNVLPSGVLTIVTTPSADEITNFTLLSELPDYDQELFEQGPDPLDEFSFFPKLPLGIRLMIFRLMFILAGRRIDIGRLIDWRINRGKQKGILSAMHFSHLATLFFNRESRSETLHRYKVIYKNLRVDRTATPMWYALCFSLSGNIFYLNERKLFGFPTQYQVVFTGANELEVSSCI